MPPAAAYPMWRAALPRSKGNICARRTAPICGKATGPAIPALACNRNIAVCWRRGSSHGAAARNKPCEPHSISIATTPITPFSETIGHPVNSRVYRGEGLLTSPDPAAAAPNDSQFHPPMESPVGHTPPPTIDLDHWSWSTLIMRSQTTGTEASSTMIMKDWINGRLGVSSPIPPGVHRPVDKHADLGLNNGKAPLARRQPDGRFLGA